MKGNVRFTTRELIHHPNIPSRYYYDDSHAEQLMNDLIQNNDAKFYIVDELKKFKKKQLFHIIEGYLKANRDVALETLTNEYNFSSPSVALYEAVLKYAAKYKIPFDSRTKLEYIAENINRYYDDDVKDKRETEDRIKIYLKYKNDLIITNPIPSFSCKELLEMFDDELRKEKLKEEIYNIEDLFGIKENTLYKEE